MRNGFGYVKTNIAMIAKFTTLFTMLVLFGLAIGMISGHHYTGLGVYALFVSFGILMAEVGLSVLSRLDTTDSPNMTSWKEKCGFMHEWLTPMKKCVLYIMLALPMIFNFTVALLGGLLLLVSALLLAGQVKYDETSPDGYVNLNPEEPAQMSVSSGDITRPGDSLYRDAPRGFGPTFDSELGTAPAPRETLSPARSDDWEMMKGAADENLLLS